MADPITINAANSAASRQLVECNNLYRTLKGKLLALEEIVAQLIGDDVTGQSVMDQFGTTDLTEALALAARMPAACAVFKASWGDPDYTAKMAELFDPTIY